MSFAKQPELTGGPSAQTQKFAEDLLYLAIGIYVFALGFVGFARNFYLRPFGLEPLHDAGPIYWGTVVHGLLCTLWLALAVFQPWLIVRRNLALHRKSGRWGAIIAFLLVISGVHVGLVQATRFAANGGPTGFVIVPLGIMAGFAIAFLLALHFRRKPAWHKRWIVIAHCMILEPAAARALSTFGIPVFPPILLLICAPILIGLVFDVTMRRKAPWLYMLGLVFVLGSGFARQGLARDPAWAAWVETLLS